MGSKFDVTIDFANGLLSWVHDCIKSLIVYMHKTVETIHNTAFLRISSKYCELNNYTINKFFPFFPDISATDMYGSYM